VHLSVRNNFVEDWKAMSPMLFCEGLFEYMNLDSSLLNDSEVQIAFYSFGLIVYEILTSYSIFSRRSNGFGRYIECGSCVPRPRTDMSFPYALRVDRGIFKLSGCVLIILNSSWMIREIRPHECVVDLWRGLILSLPVVQLVC
jgi:hypothetical protein